MGQRLLGSGYGNEQHHLANGAKKFGDSSGRCNEEQVWDDSTEGVALYLDSHIEQNDPTRHPIEARLSIAPGHWFGDAAPVGDDVCLTQVS